MVWYEHSPPTGRLTWVEGGGEAASVAGLQHPSSLRMGLDGADGNQSPATIEGSRFPSPGWSHIGRPSVCTELYGEVGNLNSRLAHSFSVSRQNQNYSRES